MRSYKHFIQGLVTLALTVILSGCANNTASRPPQTSADSTSTVAAAPAPEAAAAPKEAEAKAGPAEKMKESPQKTKEQNISKSGSAASAEKPEHNASGQKTMSAPPPTTATEGSGQAVHTREERVKSSSHAPITANPSPAPVVVTKTTEAAQTIVKEQAVALKHEVAGTNDTVQAASQPAPGAHTDTPTLAYHYPRSIKQGIPKFIFVHVNVKKPSQVSLELKQVIVNTIDNVQKEDTGVISTVQIKPYQYLTVSIEDPGKIFTISGSQDDRQMIDTLNGNDWKWSILTNSDRSTATLQIHAVGERPGLPGKERADDKIISIKIQLDRGFWRETVTYFRQNPGDFALKVVLPFFSFLAAVFWFIAKRKKGDDKEDGK